MIRTQISLTPEQHDRLLRVARERRVSMSEVIREAVDAAVPTTSAETEERYGRLAALAGAFRSGHQDTAERHDEILAEAGW
jgi:hypothetical protein